MKNALVINFLVILFSVVLYQPAFASGETIHMDAEGNTIDKATYEVIASEREKTLSIQLRNGYDVTTHAWKDPIKLRKKRIEQWRIMRSHYSPESLPRKINLYAQQ
ncbi:MAG: hypothetical protein JRE21_02920 [Deltaproteobacteria bacterium]|jgi:hypothetical protein|nr:hypothetical protein [Deltaproteobacteria bacterium]